MSDWAHIFIRSVIFIVVLILMTRMLGKKQISEINFFEYISGITIGSIAGEVIMGLDSNIGHGVLAIALFSLITLAVDYISLKSPTFSKVVDGTGTVFIKDGKIMEDNLKKERYAISDLESLLRQRSIFNYTDVEFAILEPKGDLSVLLKKENRPLTPKDINLQTPSEKVPQTVIMDGKIKNDEMATAKKDRQWLHTELDKLGVSLEDVFIGQVNSYGELTVDLYDDKIKVPSPQTRPLLIAMIKKCQADLELFALETESDKAKNMYKRNAKKLAELEKRLSPFLLR